MKILAEPPSYIILHFPSIGIVAFCHKIRCIVMLVVNWRKIALIFAFADISSMALPMLIGMKVEVRPTILITFVLRRVIIVAVICKQEFARLSISARHSLRLLCSHHFLYYILRSLFIL
jgi:hypothetical protein